MPEPFGSPRKIDLNLPIDYFSRSTTKFVEWLEANTSTLRALPEEQIILRARAALVSEISRLNDGDLAAQIHLWAKSHGFLLQGSDKPAPKSAGDSEVVDRLKKLFASIPTQVRWGTGRESNTISVSGLTRTVNSGQTQSSISLGWDRAIQFKTQTSGMMFAASVGPEQWSMSFTIGRVAPNISDLESIFKKGEAAIRGVLSNLDKVDFRDPGKTKIQFSPYLDPIKSAIDAASKAAAMRPGDVSFGAFVKGGAPGTPGAGSVSGGLGVTVIF
jgi:hypothetical protein